MATWGLPQSESILIRGNIKMLRWKALIPYLLTLLGGGGSFNQISLFLSMKERGYPNLNDLKKWKKCLTKNIWLCKITSTYTISIAYLESFFKTKALHKNHRGLGIILGSYKNLYNILVNKPFFFFFTSISIQTRNYSTWKTELPLTCWGKFLNKHASCVAV